jgi:hypothetical protein
LVSARRPLAAGAGSALLLALATLAAAGCGSSDGKVDDPGLPYAFSYPEELEEGGRATVPAQGYDNQKIVAEASGQDYVAVQTQPLRRTVDSKLVPRLKREVEQSARRTGRVRERHDVRAGGLDGVSFEMTLRGTGVPVGARWIYAAKDRTLYWINCQWQKDRAGVLEACEEVTRTFKPR